MPEGVAYDSDKTEIFVANAGSGTVSVISDSTYAVVATIPAGNSPFGVAYDSSKSEIFVTNVGDDTVSVISDSSNTVVATVPVGDAPGGVTDDSGKNEIFVTNSFDNSWTGYVSDTVKVVSDAYPLAAPFISASPSTLVQGQTSDLSSVVTTGATPYTYQWFSEAPGTSIYSLIGNATSSCYSFTTSKSMAPGNWTVMLQVTDATGAAENSTASSVTVNTQSTSVPEFSTVAIISMIVVMVAMTFCAGASAYKKSRQNIDSLFIDVYGEFVHTGVTVQL